MDADYVRNSAAGIWIPVVRSAIIARLVLVGDQLGTQPIPSYGVKRGVAGLAAVLGNFAFCLHVTQFDQDMLRRMPIAQESCDHRPEWGCLSTMR